MRGERRQRRPLGRLGFLAAEASAHASAFAHHGGIGNGEHLGDAMLHLGRMLGRAMDEHAAAFARDGERHLALEVEMLLAADGEPALQAARGARR